MDLTTSKVLSATALFITSCFFSCLPYFVVRQGLSQDSESNKRREKIISYMNCFGGGVFLSTLFFHILPAGVKEYALFQTKTHFETEYPIFNLTVCAGFFLVAIIEMGAHSYISKHRVNNSINTTNDTSSGTKEETVPCNKPQYGAFTSRPTASDEDDHNESSASGQKKYSKPTSQDDFEHNPENTFILRPREAYNDSANIQSNLSGGNGNQENEQSSTLGLRVFLLLIALSFHTIFDGLAIGLQRNAAVVWSISAAIIMHKSILVFCLSLQTFQANLQRPITAAIWLVVFSAIAPLGIGFGILLTSGSIIGEHNKLLTSFLLQGLAAGTFMHVTFLEILSKYLGHQGSGDITYLLFVLLGSALMATSKLFHVH